MIRCLILMVALGIGGAAHGDERRVQTKDAGDLELIQALDTLIPQWLRSEEIPGLNIALARRGVLVWEGAYGYADAKTRRPMTTDTVFRSGSIAKPYASVAIMQLVERGALKLDDPIDTYLPFKVVNPFGGPPITIRHLLTHRSGLGGDSAASYLCERADTIRPLAELLALAYRYQYAQAPVGTGPHRFHQMWTQPVGAQYQYSNLGVATLGVIVERANPERLSYSDYVQKHIMDRLGMQYAQMPPAQIRELIRADIWERLSTGYQVLGGAWVPTAQVCFGEFPCGGSLATPAD
ncbi:serine hydrolase domain-containing protein, partial [Steroidobacter sp.]|uniref:serine hydrolase domain-containing protein n=1 Tax=Steroidobacter sp. TaxID=1978227 RepID=UPI001A596702